MIREAFEEHEERILRVLIDDGCEKVVFAHFEEAHECAKGNVCILGFEVIEQAAVKAFFTRGADELLVDKILAHRVSRLYARLLPLSDQFIDLYRVDNTPL